jgi:hypothetical protein
MKTRFFRKISDNGGYASISLPKTIFDWWAAKGCAYVQIEYSDVENVMIISPV